MHILKIMFNYEVIFIDIYYWEVNKILFIFFCDILLDRVLQMSTKILQTIIYEKIARTPKYLNNE